MVSLKDPTGTIKGHIHNTAMDYFSSEISAGCVLILRKVAVFSPSPFEHILNITTDNIIRIFESKLRRPKEFDKLPKSKQNHKSSCIYLSPTGKGITFEDSSILSPKSTLNVTPSSRSKSLYPKIPPAPSPSTKNTNNNTFLKSSAFLNSSPSIGKPFQTPKPKLKPVIQNTSSSSNSNSFTPNSSNSSKSFHTTPKSIPFNQSNHFLSSPSSSGDYNSQTLKGSQTFGASQSGNSPIKLKPLPSISNGKFFGKPPGKPFGNK